MTPDILGDVMIFRYNNHFGRTLH